MNREILFKAKRKDNGEWVEGQYAYITNPLTEDGKPIKHLICNGTNIFNDLIDPDTLCQYTGLTDKNGKKIWENDILRGHGNDKDLSKVSFGKFYVIDAETLRRVDEVIGWHTEVIETDALSKCEPFCLPMPLTDFYIERSEFEVYGNIFDNPELLEVE
nr:MAG TPA: YopX protein [Caudoviricetes sp.]